MKFNLLLIYTSFLLSSSLGYSAEKKATKILFLGDSLTEGYGIEQKDAYPTLVEKILIDAGNKNIKIVNAGISGSTTAGGLSRINWLLKGKPTHLVLALGGNDGLRGLKIKESKKNLDTIISIGKKNGIKILLIGQKIPPNYGKDYTKEFEAMYPALAKKHGISLMPFMLEGVGGVAKYNISDGIHPNEAGHKIIATNISKYIQEFLND